MMGRRGMSSKVGSLSASPHTASSSLRTLTRKSGSYAIAETKTLSVALVVSDPPSTAFKTAIRSQETKKLHT